MPCIPGLPDSKIRHFVIDQLRYQFEKGMGNWSVLYMEATEHDEDIATDFMRACMRRKASTRGEGPARRKKCYLLHPEVFEEGVLDN